MLRIFMVQHILEGTVGDREYMRSIVRTRFTIVSAMELWEENGYKLNHEINRRILLWSFNR